MKLIKKEFIETNEGILKKTYLMLPLKKKSIKNGIERKSIFGIQYSKKQLKTQKKKSHNGLNIAFIVGCKDGRSERYSVLDIRAFYITGDDQNNKSVFSKILELAQQGKETFPFTSGKNKYDFIEINQLAEQISAASIQTEITGIINVCSGKAISLKDKVEDFLIQNIRNIQTL